MIKEARGMPARIWMLLAVLSFCIMAIAVKELDKQIGVNQIIFFRSIIGLMVIGSLVCLKKEKLKFNNLKLHFGRNVFHLIGQYGWILGIQYMSLTEVTAIEFTIPIWTVIIAALFLKERLTWNKIFGIFFGFTGILVIVQPGFQLIDSNMAIVVLSAISYGIAHSLTKALTKTNDAKSIVFLMCIIQTPVALILAYKNWIWTDAVDYGWLLLIGICATLAHYCMTMAFKKAEVSQMIILDYFRLPILLVCGMLWYKEQFETLMVLGCVCIILGNYLSQKSSIKRITKY